jgi:hypothetical protein
MTEVGNFLEIVIDPMTMVNQINWMARCFAFLWEFLRFLSFFLEYLPKILGGFTWRLQKEPPISNSKMQELMVLRSYPFLQLKLASYIYHQKDFKICKQKLILRMIIQFESMPGP